MNASTLESILQDLVNHSRYDENLKNKLRDKLNNYEQNEIKLKRIENEKRYNDEYSDENSDEDSDEDESEGIDNEGNVPHLIISNSERVPRPPTQFSIFIKNTMSKLKMEKPELRNTELMIMASKKWNEEQDKIKQRKNNLFKEIVDYKKK